MADTFRTIRDLMGRLAVEYLFFFLRSINLHGIHSPFVYGFARHCLYDKNYYSDYKTLEKYRQELIRSSETVVVKDYGVGSKVFTSTSRKVKNVARKAGSPLRRAKLLHRIARYFQPENMLELGTSLGIGCSALASGAPKSCLVSVEACESLIDISQRQLTKFGIENVSLIHLNFAEYCDRDYHPVYELIYIDGHHSGEALFHYIELLLPHTNEETVFILDDIYWSVSMRSAWKKLISDERFSLSIDCFWCGFLFMGEPQLRQHFRIRL